MQAACSYWNQGKDAAVSTGGDNCGDSAPHLEASAFSGPDGSEGSVLLQSCAPITHGEITEKVRDGGVLRGAILEAQDDSRQPKYAVFLLTNWRRGYCVLHVHWPARPRLFRDLDRLLVLIRFEYGFTGTIALKRASDVSVAVPDGKRRHWRVTL
jgi:hypothetical protein